MSSDVLNEAYERFRDTGPEWGADQLTNHGPMAVEVLVRRGRPDVVPRWVDSYIGRLDELPGATGEISDEAWAEALGDGRRIGDWTAYFTRQLANQPWQQLLATWWQRLLPGIAAGATHGVIRTGHVVRTLLAGDESQPALAELGHALAFWAARALAVPASGGPAGTLEPLAALDAVARIPLSRATSPPASVSSRRSPAGRRRLRGCSRRQAPMRSRPGWKTWLRRRCFGTEATATASRSCSCTRRPRRTRSCTPCRPCRLSSGRPA